MRCHYDNVGGDVGGNQLKIAEGPAGKRPYGLVSWYYTMVQMVAVYNTTEHFSVTLASVSNGFGFFYNWHILQKDPKMVPPDGMALVIRTVVQF